MKKQRTPRDKKPRLITEPLPESVPRTEHAPKEQAQPQPVPLILPTAVSKGVKEWDKALQRFVRDAPQAEVERFRRVLDEQRQNWEPRHIANGRLTEGSLWKESIMLWDAYHEHGDQVVFEKLPYLLVWDCAFFLRQWWISELIAAWHRAGEQPKIERVFFGSTKGTKGTRGFATVMSAYYRNASVWRAVEKIKRDTSCNYDDAYHQVSDQWQTLGLPEALSYANVKHIHAEWGKEPNPFKDLFSAPPR